MSIVSILKYTLMTHSDPNRREFVMNLNTVLIKPASSQCNMTCNYCFYCDEASKREYFSYGMMTEETLKNTIKKTLFQASGDVCFAFQGGEPTMRGLPFFHKAIEYEQRYNRNHVKISNTLQTNGLLINEDWCDFFRKHSFLIGVSVDGTKETHDQCRHTKAGSPTYEQVLESIQMLDFHHVEYNILTVVNAYTAPKIREIYADYKEKGWNFQQYIACLDPLGAENAALPHSLTPEIYGEFLVTLFDMWYKDWRRGKAPCIRDFENYIGIAMGYPPEACSQRGNCSIQGVVEADGSVYPCDFYALDEYRLGNFNIDKPQRFFENERARNFINESKKISDSCKICPHYVLCRGGCRRARIKEAGTDSYRSYFCKSYHIFFNRAGKQIAEIARYLKK